MTLSRAPLWLWLLAAAVAVLGLVALLAFSFPEVLALEGNRMRVVQGLLWVAVLGGSIVVRWRAKPGLALRHAAVWAAIAAVLFLGYSLRGEALSLGRRLLADLLPHRGQVAGGTITLTARSSGSFVVEAVVDGRKLRFLVDTGASDVILSPTDAGRLGLDLKRLRFNKRYRTANGIVLGAPVRLGSVRIGPVELTDVRASVNGAPMGLSLLGMSFLSRLSGYRVSGDKLTLWQ